MANEGFHEDKRDLSKETRNTHRALVSLQEELEAVDWYRQRADACDDSQLRAILLHNMREEMEHASMLIEWLRRNNQHFNEHLRTYLFTSDPVTELEKESTDENANAGSEGRASGTLKE
ncbi:MAG: encapsulin-associated ferritin-like protein [Lysobacterales bacterium]